MLLKNVHNLHCILSLNIAIHSQVNIVFTHFSKVMTGDLFYIHETKELTQVDFLEKKEHHLLKKY